MTLVNFNHLALFGFADLVHEFNFGAFILLLWYVWFGMLGSVQ